MDLRIPAPVGCLVVGILSAFAACSFAAPAAPTELVVTTVSATRIDLKWKVNSNDETVFVIERRNTAGGEWQIV